MFKKITLFILLCNVLFAADPTYSINLRPGMNEITVKILNECEKDINRIHLLFNRSDIPEGIRISIDSAAVNSMKDSTVSVPLKINVIKCVKDSVYNVSLVLRDNQNHSWNYSLSLNVVKTVPEKYSLEQNYPNPFNSSTIIQYGLQENSFVSMTVYNMLGERIETLINGRKSTGDYKLTWEAKVHSGIYFCLFESLSKNGKFDSMRKMVILK